MYIPQEKEMYSLIAWLSFVQSIAKVVFMAPVRNSIPNRMIPLPSPTRAYPFRKINRNWECC